MSDNLLNQILENQRESAKEMGTISEIVRRHDQETFPEIQQALLRMESKQNKDILQFNEAKASFDKRLIPLEDDYKERKERGKDTKKHFWQLTWDMIKLGIVFSIGWVASHLK